MKQSLIISLLLALVSLSASAQKHVLNCAEDLRKADLRNASVSSVIKRHPRTNKVVMRLLTIDGVSAKQMKQMVKAMDSDLKEAGYISRNSSNGVNYYVMHFNDRRSGRSVRVACQYRGDYQGGEIFVREDYSCNSSFNDQPDILMEDVIPTLNESLQYELLTFEEADEADVAGCCRIRISTTAKNALKALAKACRR